MKNDSRRRHFQRNEQLEVLLSEINGILESAENIAIEKFYELMEKALSFFPSSTVRGW